NLHSLAGYFNGKTNSDAAIPDNLSISREAKFSQHSNTTRVIAESDPLAAVHFTFAIFTFALFTSNQLASFCVVFFNKLEKAKKEQQIRKKELELILRRRECFLAEHW